MSTKFIIAIAIARSNKAASTGPLNALIPKYIAVVKTSTIRTRVSGASTPSNASETPYMTEKGKTRST